MAIDASLPSAEAMARDYEQRMAQAFSTSADGAWEVSVTALIHVCVDEFPTLDNLQPC